MTYLASEPRQVAVPRPHPGHDRHHALEPDAHGAAPIQFMVQAVDGVGLVTLDTNAGRLLPAEPDRAGAPDGRRPARHRARPGLVRDERPVRLVADALGDADLAGSPVASKAVTFTVGNSIRTGITNASGRVTAQLPLINLPGATR